MIVADNHELSDKSLLPKFKEIKSSPILEKITGADIMVSPLSAPATTDKLIFKHISSGAVLVQRKSGMDLVKSIGKRMNSSISKMHEVGATQSQCLLLYTGQFDCSATGVLTLNGKMTEVSYMSIVMAVAQWCDRGGVAMQLISDILIPDFLKNKEKKLAEYKKAGTKFVFSKPLQNVERVGDWRNTILTFPGMGEKRTNQLRDMMIKNNLGDDLITALHQLTNTNINKKLSGAGKWVHEQTRLYVGLPNEYNLCIQHESEEQNNGNK